MTARVREIASRYDMNARVYVKHWAPVLDTLSTPLLRALTFERGARALDIGCGVGTIAGMLAVRGARVTGVDASEGMLAEAPVSMARVAGGMENLPFVDASIDLAISTFALQHIPGPRRVFAEVARVLREGGTFATATWSDASAESGGPYDVLEDVATRHRLPSDPFGWRAWHARSGHPRKMQRYAREAGFASVKAWSEPVIQPWTRTSFVAWARAMGPFSRRLEATDAETREAALADAKRGLEALPDDQLAWRPKIVFCLATR